MATEEDREFSRYGTMSREQRETNIAAIKAQREECKQPREPKPVGPMVQALQKLREELGRDPSRSEQFARVAEINGR